MDARPGPYLRRYDKGAYVRLIDAQLGILAKLYRHAVEHGDMNMAREASDRIDLQLEQRHKMSAR